ncbi:MAG: DUF1302 family protein [Gammaproteobacteria bacterium]|nr:DUF1302 family protein [Gammaproteobacteria bacterium]
MVLQRRAGVKKYTIAQYLMAGGMVGGVLFADTASAIDWNITGFVRQEIAYSLNSDGNPNNDMDNPFNDRIQPNITHHEFGSKTTPTANPGDYFPTMDAVGLVPFPAGQAAGSNARAHAHTYWGQKTDGTDLVPAPVGPNPLGISLNTEFMTAGNNTNSPVDCHYSQLRALAAGSPGIGANVGAVNGIPNPAGIPIFPGALCPGGGGSNFIPGAKNNAKGSIVPPGDIALNDEDSLDFNLFNSRLEFDVQAKISDEFSAYVKTRIYYDGTRHFTDGKIGDSFGPGRWGAGMWSSRRQTLLEANTPDAILDLPAFYLDWNRGPLWVRVGNQVIAWGEAYFFRTMDVANGLDLRRHLTLGPGAEEYQDQRVASPGVRLSYTFSNGFELDAFAQMFSPTILPAQNTAYNLIPTYGARVNDEAGYHDARGSMNFGARMTMPITEQLTGIIGVVNRRNQDGVFRNVDAPAANNGRINTGCVNQYNDTLNFLGGAGAAAAVGFPTLDTRMRSMENGCGSTFAPDPTGTPSLQYWKTIQSARLNNQNYLRHVIDDFPAAKWAVRNIFNFGDEQNFVDTYRTLEGFRSSFGPFIQWVGREFKRENVFMVGGNYVVNSENPLLDQLIIRGEVSVTPNKRITHDLEFKYKEVDDIVSSMILEKYYRFSDAFPATYMVFQWMHRTATDMFGRDLDNNNTPGIENFIDGKTGQFLPAAFEKGAMDPRAARWPTTSCSPSSSRSRT